MCALNETVTREQVKRFAALYEETEYSDLEAKIEQASEISRRRGNLLRPEFIDIVRWKNLSFQTDRNNRLWASNDQRSVQSTTREAFRVASEIEGIVLLTRLRGVDVRTATALMHFGRKDRSPILDVNVLTALDAPLEVRRSGNALRDLQLYPCFAAAVRRIRARLNVPIRTLDKALFMIGRERNRRRIPSY